MKRYLIILLAFLPLISSGQIVETNRDFQFNGSITVNGSDTLLVDSITGTFDSDYKLINVDFDITLGYIPVKSTALLIYSNADTVPVNCLFQNINYADTFFVQWLDQSLDINSQEVIEKRIKRITHYSTPTSDVNNFFNTPSLPSVYGEVGVGKTYSTIDAARVGRNTGDTVLIYDGNYPENINMNKSITWIAVGFVYWNATGRNITSGAGAAGAPMIFKNIWFESLNNDVIVRTLSSNPDYYQFDHCFFETTNANINHTSAASDVTLNNCVSRKAYIVYNNKLEFNSCLLRDHPSANLRVYDTVIMNYCEAMDNSTVGLFRLDINDNYYLNVFDSKLTAKVITDASASQSGEIFMDYGELWNTTTDKTVIDMQAYTGTIPISLTNMEFVDTNGTTGNYTDIRVVGDHILQNNTSTTLHGEMRFYATSDGGSVDFSDNDFNTDNEFLINIRDYNVDISNNILISDSTSQLFVRGESYLVEGDIKKNEITSKKDNGAYIVKIGNELFYNKTKNITFTGNIVTGSKLFTGESASTHGVWFQGGDGNTVEHNFIQENFLGLIIKSNGTNNDSSLYAYNVIKNCDGAVTIKGAPQTKLYNNTIYNTDDTLVFGVKVQVDEDFPTEYSDSCDIKNNIITDLTAYGTGELFNFESLSDTVGVDLSNNQYYKATGSVFKIAGITRDETFWTANMEATYYTTNPNLNTNGVPGTGSDAIGNGLNLGSPYNIGLTPNTTFPNPATEPQKALWTIGAYITNLNRTATSNSKIIMFGNKYIKY